MNKFVKCLIAGGIIFAIGIVVLIIGLSLNGWTTDPEFTAESWTQQESKIKSISIKFDAGELETEYYDGDKIIVDYYVADVYKVTVNQNGDNLTIDTGFSRKFGWFGWWFNIKIPKMTVKLPMGTTYDLSVHLSAGTVKIAGGTFGKIDARVSAGTLSFQGNTKCDNINIDLSAGTVNIGNSECGSFKLDMSAGSANISNLTCSSLVVAVSAGSANITNITCPKIDVKVSAGSANIGVIGAKSEYTLDVSKSAGNCNISSSTGSDPNKKVTVRLSAGSVTINFSQS